MNYNSLVGHPAAASLCPESLDVNVRRRSACIYKTWRRVRIEYWTHAVAAQRASLELLPADAESIAAVGHALARAGDSESA